MTTPLAPPDLVMARLAIVIGSIFGSFAAGYFIGAMRSIQPVNIENPALPPQYDNALKLSADALAQQIKATEACYQNWIKAQAPKPSPTPIDPSLNPLGLKP